MSAVFLRGDFLISDYSSAQEMYSVFKGFVSTVATTAVGTCSARASAVSVINTAATVMLIIASAANIGFSVFS